MITYYVISILIGFIGALLSPIGSLPDVSLPISITGAFSQAGHLVGIIYNLLPDTITAIFSALSAIVGIEIAIFTYKLIKWIYTKIPGIS